MIALGEIEAARDRIADVAVRTPLVRLALDDAPAEIYVKLETLQPINSFKIRGAANAVRKADPELRERGLLTASAGNMAQGVAWVGPRARPAGDDRRARARAGGEARRDRPARRPRPEGPLRRLVAGDRDRAGSRASMGCSCTRSPTKG